MRETNTAVKHNPQLKNQEYVPVTYDPKYKESIPLIWRIKNGYSTFALGNSQYSYGQIFLDSIWENVWNEPEFSDEKKVIEITSHILETYFHEFLHSYYFTRMEPDDMAKEYHIKPNKIIQQVKGKMRTEKWGWSEPIVKRQGQLLMYYTILSDQFTVFLMNTLREEIEEIRKNEPKTL